MVPNSLYIMLLCDCPDQAAAIQAMFVQGDNIKLEVVKNVETLLDKSTASTPACILISPPAQGSTMEQLKKLRNALPSDEIPILIFPSQLPPREVILELINRSPSGEL